MNFFVLAWSDWEDYVPHFFSGPSMGQEEFMAICNSLAPTAAANAVVHDKKEGSSYVGWNDVVDHMIPLLEGSGFTLIKPIKVAFSGSMIIREDERCLSILGTSSSLVCQHNQKIEDLMHEEHLKMLAEIDATEEKQ